MKVKIENIKIMERIRKEITKIDELAEDIRANGLLNPVTVMIIEGEKLRLLAGLRRLRAVEKLGHDDIDVNIVSPADAEAALRIEISENEQRVGFTFSEQMDFARLLEEIEREKAGQRVSAGQSQGGKTSGNGRVKEKSCSVPLGAPSKKGKTRDIVAEKLGMGKTNYVRAKYIAENAPAEIIEELDSGKRKIRPTYDELRSKARPGQPPDNYMSKQDKEALRKIQEFAAMSPEEKVVELQKQLKEERARAAEAESELSRLKELHHNDNLHNNANIENLKMQLKSLETELDVAYARIKELEDG